MAITWLVKGTKSNTVLNHSNSYHLLSLFRTINIGHSVPYDCNATSVPTLVQNYNRSLVGVSDSILSIIIFLIDIKWMSLCCVLFNILAYTVYSLSLVKVILICPKTFLLFFVKTKVLPQFRLIFCSRMFVYCYVFGWIATHFAWKLEHVGLWKTWNGNGET